MMPRCAVEQRDVGDVGLEHASGPARRPARAARARSSLPASCCDTVLIVASSAARFCDSANRRAFSIATVACSESPTRKSSSVSSNGLPPVRHTAIAPLTVLPAISGATISRSSLLLARCRRSGWRAGPRSVSLMNSARPLFDHAADDAVAGLDHRRPACASAMSPIATIAR